MARHADPRLLRAEAAVVPWLEILRRQEEQVDGQRHPHGRAVDGRPRDLQLRWICAARLGVPSRPFTVWSRRRSGDHLAGELRDVVTFATTDGALLVLGGDMGIVEVQARVRSGGEPALLLCQLDYWDPLATVGAATRTAPAGTTVTLHVRCGGTDRAWLYNADVLSVRGTPLAEIANGDDWTPREVVGMPVPGGWEGHDYDPREQGLVGAEVSPDAAAVQRLQRGAPPLGWDLVTDRGGVAPPWAAADPVALVEEVQDHLLPEIVPVFRGVAEPDRGAIVDDRDVDPPSQDGRVSSLPARAGVPLQALLLLPAASDPFLALATGFGTAYLDEGEPIEESLEHLVTVGYDALPDGLDPGEMAAYAPGASVHGVRPPIASMTAKRAGLVTPALDGPWRETVRVQWRRQPTSAAMGRETAAVLAVHEPTVATPAVCLIPPRDSGGWRPLVPSPAGEEGQPGHDLAELAHTDAVIPLGSGGRSATYALATGDVWGVWSPWESVDHADGEPARPLPRPISATVETSYDGSTTCPATLTVEVAVDWSIRTPAAVELAWLFHPMPTVATEAPVDLPPAVAPPGTFTGGVTLPFSGAVPIPPVGTTVVALDEAGNAEVPPGPRQGEGGRRYRVTTAVPTLDFSTHRRWGVRVWARSPLVALPGPVPWSPPVPPPPAEPVAVTATAASPVPSEPVPPPQLPGVPLGSMPDADGRSHVRLRWSLPAGADVEHVVVWEVAETALRQHLGLPQRAADGVVPGARLMALQTAYDGQMTPDERRSVFRRHSTLPRTARELDVALPRGSTDIHLFAVTTTTEGGVEGPWPSTPTPHETLQAYMAPQLVQPSPPAVRAVIQPDGTWRFDLESTSRAPVLRFELHRTRKRAASDRVATMGPPFALVTAAVHGNTDPASGPVCVHEVADTIPDPATGGTVYCGRWAGAMPAAWDPWLVRAVAVPVDRERVLALRGDRSPDSPLVTVTALPTDPPDLAPLTGEVWGEANDGVVVRTSTTAPVPPTSLGAHRLRATVDSTLVAAIDLDDVPVDEAAPPAGAATDHRLVRGPAAGGSTPLTLWFARPDRSVDVDVEIALVDPRGRTVRRSTTVVGWVPPALDLRIVDVFSIVGRGHVVTLETSLPVGVEPPVRLHASAVLDRRLPFEPPFRPPFEPAVPPIPPTPPIVPPRRFELPRDRFDDPRDRLRPARRWTLDVAFDDIPFVRTPPRGTGMRVVRTTAEPPHTLTVIVPTSDDVRFTALLVAEDGRRSPTVQRRIG